MSSPATEAAAAAATENTTLHRESIGAALVDAARISIMGAMELIPEEQSVIVLPGQQESPAVHELLDQAMGWLDVARAQLIASHAARGAPPTSIHVIEGREREVQTRDG